MPEAHEHVSGGLRFGSALYRLGRPTNVACGLQPTEMHCKLDLHHVRPGAEFWLNLQRNVDLWVAARGLERELASIRPIQVA